MTQKETAESVVRSHVLWSMGAGLIPLPILDSIAVTGVQIDMLKQLSAVYGQDFSASAGKSYISALAGAYLARLGASALKAIPGFGSIIGGVSLSVLSGATTYALGTVFTHHYESGGDFGSFDPAKMKDFFAEQFEKGKEKVQEMKKEQEAKESASTSSSSTSAGASSTEQDALKQLQDLKEMFEKGLISEEEYAELKKKVFQGM